MRANEVAARITPEQVQEIFHLKALGSWQQDIPTQVNKLYPEMVQITEHNVRQILHRREPFDVPSMYSRVSDAVANAVLHTFKSRGPNKERARKKPDTATTSTAPILDNVDQTAACLAKVLKARMDYDKALAEAKALGFSCDAVKAWISMATGGDLQ